MTAGRCAGCVFWETDDATMFHAASRPAGWSICKRSEGMNDRPVVGEGEYGNELGGPSSGAQMYAQDGSDYWAALITSPVFGCSEFRSANGTGTV